MFRRNLKNVKLSAKTNISVDDLAKMIEKLSPEEKEILKTKLEEKENVSEKPEEAAETEDTSK